MPLQANNARTFRGRSSSEIISLIKRELGDDAVILSTKNLPQTGAGPRVEIEAVSSAALVQNTPSPVRTLMSALESNGVSEALVTAFSDRYNASTENSQALDHLALRKSVAALLPVRPHRQDPPRLLAVVGPTGVGKTTTIAKLAIADRQAGLKVGLITIDTHRIGGVEQLSRYAALIGAPMKAAATKEQLRHAVDSLRDQDRIYIDTAGSGPRGEERLRELSLILEGAPETNRLMLLPASGNEPDLKRMAKSFETVAPSLVGVTKTDETCYFGLCFNVLCEMNLPLSIFGTGQVVPDDLEDASSTTLASMISRVRH